MNFRVRSIAPKDEPFLWEMLYQAIYIPPGAEPVSRDIIYLPELARYVANWGREGDCGFIAIERASDRTLGAVWLRLLPGSEPGYGYIDDSTPELAIAVVPEYRGLGIGTALMTELWRWHGTLPICLSVSRDSPARRLYDRFGFQVVSDNAGSLIMCRLGASGQ